MVDKSRVIFQESIEIQGIQTGETVVYWMNRDQRVQDNWALQYAYEKALTLGQNLAVFYVIESDVNKERLTRREFDFTKQGLLEVEDTLRDLNIPFHIGVGDQGQVLVDYFHKLKGSMLITDFSPLNEVKVIRESVSQALGLEIHVVDAHNIVPCWITSNKEEYAARTIRPKINKLLDVYLTNFPLLKAHGKNDYEGLNRPIYDYGVKEGMPSEGSLFLYPLLYTSGSYVIDWAKVERVLTIDETVGSVSWIKPGYKAGMAMLKSFIEERLSRYSEGRNDPNANAQSNLSPYFHFGHISAQRVAYEMRHYVEPSENTDDFLEEMIIRRELTDNYCNNNRNYKSLDGIKEWAKTTLNDHLQDQRNPSYTLGEMESATTQDMLWNAAQMEMVHYGKMHGYMRMYWAKKILEWSPSPEHALEWAIYLNDKYALDGKDPNGYVGVLWSVGGLHDRAWKEREIYGKIRYMNYNGCKRKFDVNAYIQRLLGEMS